MMKNQNKFSITSYLASEHKRQKANAHHHGIVPSPSCLYCLQSLCFSADSIAVYSDRRCFSQKLQYPRQARLLWHRDKIVLRLEAQCAQFNTGAKFQLITTFHISACKMMSWLFLIHEKTSWRTHGPCDRSDDDAARARSAQRRRSQPAFIMIW